MMAKTVQNETKTQSYINALPDNQNASEGPKIEN